MGQQRKPPRKTHPQGREMYPVNQLEEGVPTETTLAEANTHQDCSHCFTVGRVQDLRREHITFAMRGLLSLPPSVAGLDASRTWLCYWNLNSVDLLGQLTPFFQSIDRSAVVEFLAKCFTTVSSPDGDYGGFGGGPKQMPHLAPTLSATLALCIVGTPEAFDVLRSRKDLIRRWFLRLRQPSGAVVMHEDGEVDIRGSYCYVLVAVLLGLATPDVVGGMAEYIGSCQTYEGGLGCKPYEEAHGGYTYCGLAALALLRSTHVISIPRLKRWLALRQTPQGGFNGRTNKLVDACYSFWVGGATVVADALEAEERRAKREDGRPCNLRDAMLLDTISYTSMANPDHRPSSRPSTPPLPAATDGDEDDEWITVDDAGMYTFNHEALQNYIVLCCQDREGGLRDKPSVNPDYYHTCYALSGWAFSQNLAKSYHCARAGLPSILPDTDAVPGLEDLAKVLEDDDTDSLKPVFTSNPPPAVLRHSDALFNIRKERVEEALKYFHGSPVLPPRPC
eukprot:Sspe_Gene.13705::Locus_4700_Transcript_2_2_Confidence_0.667_Length_8293::g.13705::m.13705/K05954/FNTB; protein farnesyltransferase subunit beta